MVEHFGYSILRDRDGGTEMYSVVLMATLTAGSATPDWHRGGGCCGCYGGCYGCCGGCFGGGCYGCFGGFYGGGYGGGYSDGYGCWGGYSSWGFGDSSHPGTVVPGVYGMTGGTVVPGTATGAEELDKPKPNKKNDDKEAMAPTRAKLVVVRPANAKLFIDDMPVKATAGVQTFNTPALEPGQAYFYMVRIERMRDGRPVSETRRIIVRAGQVARADFKDVKSEAVRTAQAK
jgi:uncharacterized protein (TIGR03000 family)